MGLATFMAAVGAAAIATTAAAATAPCLVLGDSIALALARFRPACDHVAVKGVTSDVVVATAPADRHFTVVIVAMGSNDRKRSLPQNLAAIRARYPGAVFAWIAPYKDANGLPVKAFAKARGDTVVQLTDFATRDGVHPLDYAALAERLP